MLVFRPSLFTWKIVEHPEGLACVRRWKAAVGESSLEETFSAAMTILYLYFPFVFIGLLNLIISLKMKANKIIGLQSVNVREQRLKRERNVLKMCIAIVLVFAVCWVPFSIWWLLFLCSSDRTISSCGFQFFGVIAVFLRRSNCAAVLKELIRKIERIQRRATKYILNLPFLCEESFKDGMIKLTLLSVSYWHEYLDIVFFL